MHEAARLRDEGHGTRMTYSPKVFIPLTMLCRDRCGYCTFAKPPARLDHPYLDIDAVLDIARAGAVAGCSEALFTLGPDTGNNLIELVAFPNRLNREFILENLGAAPVNITFDGKPLGGTEKPVRQRSNHVERRRTESVT